MLTTRLTIPQAKARDRARLLLAGGCVILDTETTGLGAADRVIELAVVGADGAVLLDTRIDPERPIPAEATAIHGLTDADVAGAPTLAATWPRIIAALAGRTVAAYNAAFDRRLLARHAAGSGLFLPPGDWCCAMQLASEAAGLARWVRLGEACARFGVTPGGAHSAAGDATATLALLRAIAGLPTATG